MLDNLHLYLGGQVVIVTFLKLLHRIFFTCSCLKINKTSTWIGGRVVIIRNQAGSGSWGSGGHWEPALPEASSENKGFFLKFKTASLPFFYWDSDDGTFCLKVYWGKVVDKQEGSVSQWINNQKEFFVRQQKELTLMKSSSFSVTTQKKSGTKVHFPPNLASTPCS